MILGTKGVILVMDTYRGLFSIVLKEVRKCDKVDVLYYALPCM